MTRHRTSTSDINAAERARLALMLRKQGFTLDDIAKQVGYTHRSAVSKAIKRELANIPTPEAVDLRKLEDARLDDMLMGIYNKAKLGDTWAIDRVIAISKRRSELLGLDVKVDEVAINQNYTKRIILELPEVQP